MPRRLILSTLLISVAAACDGPGRTAEVVVRDSAGLPIVEVPPEPEVVEWALPAAPSAVIGDPGGGEAYDLYQPLHALRLDDGRIVVANQGTQELRFYTGEGRHLQTVGRRGGGPGEFEDLWGLVRMPGDSIAAWDFSARRLTVYDDTGGLGRIVTPAHDLGFVPRLLGAFRDGSFLVTRGVNPGALFQRGGGVLEDSVTLLRLAPDDGAVLDSLGPYPGDQRYLQVGEGQFWIRSIPYGRSEQIAVAGDDLHVGDDRRGEIRSYDPAGSLTRILRLTGRSEPVTDERLTRLYEARLEEMPPERVQEERDRLRQIPPAEMMPAFSDLAADRLGRTWVRAQPVDDTADTAPWLVHGPDGRPTGRIRLPRRARLLDAGADYLLLYLRDEDDIERVLLFRLDMAGP